MPVYISSKGEEKDTTTMPLSYIYNALKKAQDNQDTENITALQQELSDRGESSIDISNDAPDTVIVEDNTQ